jgi:hypothetical protein
MTLSATSDIVPCGYACDALPFWCQPAHNRQSAIIAKLTDAFGRTSRFAYGFSPLTTCEGIAPGYESARRLHLHKTRGAARQMFATKKEKVLTVTVTNSPTEERWILQGRLGWPWVNQLRGDWRNARRTTETPRCIVDLNGVTFIDKIGKRMLRVMAIQGAQFDTSNTGMRHVLENLTNIDDGASQTAPGGTLRHSDECAAVFPPAAAVGQ